MRVTPPLPLPTKRAMTKLGGDIKRARIRRGITMALMAERVFTTRGTLQKVERGDPNVSMGIYATVLFVLGLTERLYNLAEFTHDTVALMLEEEKLPKRVRHRKEKRNG